MLLPTPMMRSNHHQQIVDKLSMRSVALKPVWPCGGAIAALSRDRLQPRRHVGKRPRLPDLRTLGPIPAQGRDDGDGMNVWVTGRRFHPSVVPHDPLQKIIDNLLTKQISLVT
jgi:hypothetical protein